MTTADLPDLRSALVRRRARALRPLLLIAALALFVTACAEPDPEVTGPTVGGPAGDAGEVGGEIRMARATWATGHFQAAVYQQLLEELGYDVTDPAEATRTPATFYPALVQRQFDLWANGWFPLHEPFLEGERFTGQRYQEPIEPVGVQVDDGAVQGYLIDRATAEALDITSMEDLSRPEVRDAFDQDGDGRAELYGCEDGWGCHLVIEAHLEQLSWGSQAEQIVGDYDALMAEVLDRIVDGEPTLFYTWTPNWTTGVLVPGEDVVWLESPALPDQDRSTSVTDLPGCAAADPCQLGWVVNDIRAVANTDFLEANPPVRTLLEEVTIPLPDIAAQNARMEAAEEYTEEDLRADAEAWIAANRAAVDGWLDRARP
ncbi:MAG: glycine betaine/L-proline ABC transporter substrate-binding protein ProX [Nitriliruptoraceae bacterium]